ncbi:hypothetical protein GCM10010424_35860 [Streptomyces lienomycini]
MAPLGEPRTDVPHRFTDADRVAGDAPRAAGAAVVVDPVVAGTGVAGGQAVGGAPRERAAEAGGAVGPPGELPRPGGADPWVFTDVALAWWPGPNTPRSSTRENTGP